MIHPDLDPKNISPASQTTSTAPQDDKKTEGQWGSRKVTSQESSSQSKSITDMIVVKFFINIGTFFSDGFKSLFGIAKKSSAKDELPVSPLSVPTDTVWTRLADTMFSKTSHNTTETLTSPTQDADLQSSKRESAESKEDIHTRVERMREAEEKAQQEADMRLKETDPKLFEIQEQHKLLISLLNNEQIKFKVKDGIIWAEHDEDTKFEPVNMDALIKVTTLPSMSTYTKAPNYNDLKILKEKRDAAKEQALMVLNNPNIEFRVDKGTVWADDKDLFITKPINIDEILKYIALGDFSKSIKYNDLITSITMRDTDRKWQAQF